MSINTDLLNIIKTNLYLLGDSEKLIMDFFEASVEKRPSNAIVACYEIMKPNEKQTVIQCIKELYSFELKSSKGRDHVAHCLFCFLLGIAIDPNLARYHSSLFEWKIASLFHDVAYPLSYGEEHNKTAFINTVNTILREYNNENSNNFINTSFDCNEYSECITELSALPEKPKRDSFRLIQECLSNYNIRIKTIDKKDCHGVLSAYTIMRLLDALYRKENPYGLPSLTTTSNLQAGQKIFDEHIVNACTAIFLHNLDKKYFTENKICYDSAPIAFLLKLCDELQDWERPPKTEGEYSAESYSIAVINPRLIHYGVSDKKRRDAIREALEGCLYVKIDVDDEVLKIEIL